MATEEPQTSSVVRVPAEPEIAGVQVIGQVELGAPAVPVVRVALVVPVSPVARVASVVPVSPVVPEDPVVPENPVALELAPAEAAQEHDRVEVPLRTKSVIAAHPRGQVPVLAAEDLAAAAETTLAPAAAEVAEAWAAAG